MQPSSAVYGVFIDRSRRAASARDLSSARLDTLISQSGAVATAIMDWAARQRLGLRFLANSYDDVGIVVNPLLAAGQIMGGALQGIAQAL